jgi:hypothetical protein
MTFKNWLEEAVSASEDKSHYTHLEDVLITDGSKGIPKILVSLIDLVKGIPTTASDTKIDGSPSVFFGKVDGRFFVATKSIFNVNPKYNFTNADIDRNHGHASGLVAKLKLALKYFPSIYNSNSILQGDMMFAKGDVETRDIDDIPHYVFQPNTVANAIPVDSDLGRMIKASKVGFAVHTKYTADGKRVQIQASDTKPSRDVFAMPVTAPMLSSYGHIQADINSLRSSLNSVSRPGLALISSPEVEPLFMVYKNAMVRVDAATSYDGFVSFVKAKFQKEIDAAKMPKTKAAKQQIFDDLIGKLESHSKQLADVIRVHSEIERLKDRVIDELNALQPIRRFFKNEFGDLKQANVEGYVTYNNHGTTKFVKRSEFSKQNFLAGSMRKAPVTEAVSKTAVIMPLGRFQPPHKDHMNLINATLKAANMAKGTPVIFVSAKVDNKKNPLTMDEKIKYLKKMYPGHAGLFQAPPAKNPTLIGSVKAIEELGFTDLIVVLGDDRVREISVLLNKYNNKEFHFNTINVISRHDVTNTRAGGSDGVHASDIRRWAMEGDFDNMREAMAPKLSDTDVKTIMRLIKNRIK